MNCTHPVLYEIEGHLKCIICGARIAADSDETAKVNPSQEEETAPEQPKNAVKRNPKKKSREVR